MKKYYFLSLLLIILNLCLFSQNVDGIKSISFFEVPSGEKIFLRYSTIDEVIALLGEPDSEFYNEIGDDVIWWENFWTYTFKDGDLIIDFYNPTREIIAVYANFEELDGFKFPFDISSKSKSNKIFDRIKEDVSVTNYIEEKRSLYFYLGDPEEFFLAGLISYKPKKPQFCLYYEVPWDEIRVGNEK